VARTRFLRHRPGLWLVIVAIVAAIGVTLWWKMAHWHPALDEYPAQGVWLTGGEDSVDMPDLRQAGAGFVYVTASMGAVGSNPQFADTLDAARAAGLPVGAVHIYDPCRRADEQSGNFVTIVPRDRAMLAPAILLDGSGEACHPRVRPAELESELVTFLNQIEMHTGERAILAPTKRFEGRYHFGARATRKLWLMQDWLEPDYAGRPWELWTVNDAYRLPAVSGPVYWVVARP